MLEAGYSTATTSAVAAFVASLWHLGEIRRCVLLNRGFNDIYAIDATAGRFVFRISGIRARGPADVADETAFIAHLAAQGVPVADAIPTRGGPLFASADMPEGPRPVVLFREAPGRAPGPDSPEDAAAQGRTLAALHQAARSYPGRGGYPLDAARLLHLPLSAISALGMETEATRRDLAALSARLDQRLAVIAPTLSMLRCHGDCHGLNARIGRDQQAVFFDFDDGGPGFLAYDLAVHLWAQLSFGRRRHAIWHAFLAGYREIRSLAPADAAAVELFVPMRHLWVMGEFCGLTTRWGREAITAEWLARETAFLLAWEQERLGPTLF